MDKFFLLQGDCMFTGVYTALITPFSENGKIDFIALEKLLNAQLAAGVHGFVFLGTTGEAATLTSTEKEEVLSFCTSYVRGKAKIIIGTGTNNTQTTLENTRQAAAFHPDGVLIVTPYYNKPNPSGLIAHYEQASQIGLPIVLYHIPGRTGLKLSNEVLSSLLAAVPAIKAVKESDYDMVHVTDTAVAHRNRINYICGNDDLFPQYLAINAAGIISAAANIFAPAFVKIYNLFKAGKTAEAFAVFAQVYPLVKACYLETNPTCVKYMLSVLGFGSQQPRLPLGEISAEHKTQIDALLKTADSSWHI